ncbi:isoprenylcysteine carboxyl methyltransferase family protein [Bradyrhizobium japonicum]|uniref:isoprenylcysteine carboxyl methyltransferase family protein n=1 Tax=Bradyrhizobium japonicum TaxID=375 RepID=UPI0004AFCC17|nr:isoprenylcysteine carboxylmethyltransferase family protein [Bradyrhizobium japonicum]
MTFTELILGAITLQRVGELVISRANTRKLLARGAVEVAPRHYPSIITVHAAWLLSLWVFGRDQPVNVVALAGYLILQCLRFWVIWTLGSRWTTRIIVLPEQPLVSAGPYRFLSHPNYAVLPLVLGLPLLAIVFTILNAAVLAIRIRAENLALAASRETLCVAHDD